MNEPITPNRIVWRMVIDCLPGTSARAMKPAKNPMIMRPTMVPSMSAPGGREWSQRVYRWTVRERAIPRDRLAEPPSRSAARTPCRGHVLDHRDMRLLCAPDRGRRIRAIESSSEADADQSQQPAATVPPEPKPKLNRK